MTEIIDLTTHQERHISPLELARYWNVGVKSIYRDIEKGALLAVKVRGQWRIPIDDARTYGQPVDSPGHVGQPGQLGQGGHPSGDTLLS